MRLKITQFLPLLALVIVFALGIARLIYRMPIYLLKNPIVLSGDFGKSNFLFDGNRQYSWIKQDFQSTWGKPASMTSEIVASIPLFANPVSNYSITINDKNCGEGTYMAKATDLEGHLFRLIIQPTTSCKNALLFFNQKHLTTLELYKLTRSEHLTPPPPITPSTFKEHETTSFSYELSMGEWFAKKLRTLASDGLIHRDFRLVNYVITDLAIAREISNIAKHSEQSLILFSSEFLTRSSSLNIVDHWLSLGHLLPVYFVVRSPIAYDDKKSRYVTHVKLATLDNQLGFITSASLESAIGRQTDVITETTEQNTVRQLEDVVISILDRNFQNKHVLTPETTLIDYNYPALELKQEDKQYYQNFIHFVSSAQKSFVATLIHPPHDEFWVALNKSNATKILLFCTPNITGLHYIKRMLKKIQLSKPGREVHLIGISNQNNTPDYYLHARAYMIDQSRCAYSDSSFSPMGGEYSDQAIWYPHDNQQCQNFHNLINQLLGNKTTQKPDLVTSSNVKLMDLQTLRLKRIDFMQNDAPEINESSAQKIYRWFFKNSKN